MANTLMPPSMSSAYSALSPCAGRSASTASGRAGPPAGDSVLARRVEQHVGSAVAPIPQGEGMEDVHALLDAYVAVHLGTVRGGQRADEREQAHALVVGPVVRVRAGDDHAPARAQLALHLGKGVAAAQRGGDLFIRLVERAGADVVAVFVEHADAQGAAVRGVDGGQQAAGADGVHQVGAEVILRRFIILQGDEEVEQLRVGRDLGASVSMPSNTESNSCMSLASTSCW